MVRGVNLVLLEPRELASGPRVALDGRRALHIASVLKPEIGETIGVGEVGGRLGRAVVHALSSDRVELEVALDAEPPAPLPVELVLALPRPKILRKVLQAIASMGIKRAVLLGSYRVEKSYWQTPFLEPEALRDELLLGLEQGRDTALPEIRLARFFKPFVEDELDATFPEGARLLPHPKTETTLALPTGARRCVLAIGPEGGWTDYEARTLEERGFAPFTLGPRILRVDVAVPYLTGLLADRLTR